MYSILPIDIAVWNQQQQQQQQQQIQKERRKEGGKDQIG